MYRRYAGLYFCFCVDVNDNNLGVFPCFSPLPEVRCCSSPAAAYMEAIHNFVEVLNKFFTNVCELDLLFNFHQVRSVFFLPPYILMGLAIEQVYALVDEMFLAGEIQETAPSKVLTRLELLTGLE